MLRTDKRTYTLTLVEPMLGTVPKDREIYATYIASKAPDGAADDEVETVTEDLEAKGWTGFHSDDNGLFVYDYLVKGFLKEAGNTLKEQLSVKALRSKLDQFVFVAPRRLYLLDPDGAVKTTPDHVVERPLRAMTCQSRPFRCCGSRDAAPVHRDHAPQQRAFVGSARDHPRLRPVQSPRAVPQRRVRAASPGSQTPQRNRRVVSRPVEYCHVQLSTVTSSSASVS